MPCVALADVVAFANGVIVYFRDAIAAFALLHLDHDVNQQQQQRADIVAMKIASLRAFLDQ